MLMAADGVQAGAMTVGQFVLVNTYLMQLYQPLNFMGMLYREIKQAVIDIEMMFGILGREPEIRDRPGAPALQVAGGEIVFDHVDFHYDKARPILHDVNFRVAPGISLISGLRDSTPNIFSMSITACLISR